MVDREFHDRRWDFGERDARGDLLDGGDVAIERQVIERSAVVAFLKLLRPFEGFVEQTSVSFKRLSRRKLPEETAAVPSVDDDLPNGISVEQDAKSIGIRRHSDAWSIPRGGARRPGCRPSGANDQADRYAASAVRIVTGASRGRQFDEDAGHWAGRGAVRRA